ncbi:hypothetical protein P152DRAFT_332257 [Eremomyces bilateralis CBS 781.70]|uniref:Uncharacterized protein n=1 Tax=Eremomyces bilateralis CBS 781.70 TaxID=1392243 RepID=A0A6G1G4I4_9PEZI|nr:uncharacterized protein P152DRAFT_332257 [Eremomyces bilateralis CBS 781.70]KAF1812974.1 hypothetical protein P152DRAFT_332257 [Eremomyces bilateralis CBS 781.70]
MISSRSTIVLQRSAIHSSPLRLPISARRTYADASERIKGKKQGGPAPYIIGAVLFCVPLGYYLWSNASRTAAKEQAPLLPHQGSGDPMSGQKGPSNGVADQTIPLLSRNPDTSNKGEDAVETAKIVETIQSEQPTIRRESMRENQETRAYQDPINKPS